jgi:hypothetical protein
MSGRPEDVIPPKVEEEGVVDQEGGAILQDMEDAEERDDAEE